MAIKLALIDDDALFRKGLRSLVVRLDDAAVVKEYRSVPSTQFAQNSSEAFDEDLVLLDYHLPNIDFSESLSAARSCFANARIVVVSGDETASHIIRSISQGAAGFIPKSSSPEVLVAALKLVLLGQTYLPKQAMVLVPHNRGVLRQAYAKLSVSQRTVLAEVVAGKSNKVIAIEQGLALGTIKSHLSTAFATLGVRNRTEAVMALSASVAERFFASTVGDSE